VAAFSWFLKSDYQYCVQMDCDFSHSFIDLKNLLAEINNSDLIIGSRYIKGGSTEGWGTYRKLLSKYANKLAKISLNSEIRDLTGGFKLMNREVISKILDSQPKSNGYTFQIEVNQLVEKNLFEIKEVPITFKERASGKSKMNFGIIVEAFFFLLKNFTNNIIK
jgi:dolichol-phosphate mannosyltransferase